MALIVRKSLPDLPLFMGMDNPVATKGGAHQARELGFSRVTVSPFISRDEVKNIISQPGETEFCVAWPGCAPGIVHRDWPYQPVEPQKSFSNLIKLRGVGLDAVSLVVKPDDPVAAYGFVKALRLILDQGTDAMGEAVSLYHRGQSGSIDLEIEDQAAVPIPQNPVPDSSERTRREQAEQRLVRLVSRFRVSVAPSPPTVHGDEKITLRAPLSAVEDFLDWLWPDNVIIDLDEEQFKSLKRGTPGGIEKQRIILAFPEMASQPDWNRMRAMIDELLWSGYRRWLADDLDQFRFIRSLAVQEIWAGWNLPVANKAASALFAQLGCRAALMPLTMDRLGIETGPLWSLPLETVLCVHARPVLRGTVSEEVPTEGDEALFKILADTGEMCMMVPRRPYSLTHYLHAFRNSGINHFLMDLRFDSLFQRNLHGVILAYQHVSSEPGGTTLMYQPRPDRDKERDRNRGRESDRDHGRDRGKEGARDRSRYRGKEGARDRSRGRAKFGDARRGRSQSGGRGPSSDQRKKQPTRPSNKDKRRS
ncbi:MAG: hypothetical protein U9P14_08090 [Gemmatimonadota bacterium]|nr:hypothetical protein [Gemmatimonadota bacterium]